MKINPLKFIAFAAVLFFVLGCGAISKIQKQVEKTQEPLVFTSNDGWCQLTTPGSWSKETSLNTEATLQASNRLQEQYVIVIRESRQDFGKAVNLSMVTKVVRENVQKNLANAVLTEPQNVTINGFPATQFEAGGELQNIKAKYLYGIVETPQNYYQVMTWTLASRFDENRPTLQQVIESFKEVGGGANTATTPFNPQPNFNSKK